MMEFKIQFFGRVFSISIGHKTYWFEQLPLILIVEEFYNERREVDYANYIWSTADWPFHLTAKRHSK